MKTKFRWSNDFFPIFLILVLFAHGPFLLFKWIGLQYAFDVPLLLVILLSNKWVIFKKKDIPLYIGFAIYSIQFLGQKEYSYFIGVLFAIMLVVVLQNLSKKAFNRFCDLYIYVWVLISLHILLSACLFAYGVLNLNDLKVGIDHTMRSLTLYFGTVAPDGFIPFPAEPVRFVSYFKEPSNMVVFQIFFMLLAIYRKKYFALTFVYITALVLSYSLNLYVYLVIYFCFYLSYGFVKNYLFLFVGFIIILWLVLISEIPTYASIFIKFLTGMNNSGLIRATFYEINYGNFTLFGGSSPYPVGILFDLAYIGLIPLIGFLIIFTRKFFIPRHCLYNCAVYSYFLAMLLVQYYGSVGLTFVVFIGVLYKISKLHQVAPHYITP
jgi:hypothetical protein